MLNKKPLILVTGILLFNTNLSADVVSDGTLGTRVEVIPTETGTHFRITDGLQKENNLFHSFSDFGIGSTESATFTESGIPNPSLVRNILARVTGGNESRIYGQLSSEIGRADLYLINPNGIMFSENASLNVPGSFHAATADYLRLGEKAYFYASLSKDSTFISASPTAFGFLDNNPASITLKGKDVFLEVPEEQNLSLYGGKVELENSILHAPSGRINIAAVASAGEVVPTLSDLRVEASKKGELNFSHSSDERRIPIGPDGQPLTFEDGEPMEYANIDVTNYTSSEGTGQGQIYIRGGKFVLERVWIFADTSDYEGEQRASIDISIDGDIDMTHGARITADNLGNSQGGRITIKAENLRLSGQDVGSEPEDDIGGQNVDFEEDDVDLKEDDFGGQSAETDFEEDDFSEPDEDVGIEEYEVPFYDKSSTIATNNFGDGTGGDIQIEVRGSLELSPGTIISATEGGDAGNIRIDAREVTLREGGFITASVAEYGYGQGGNITINATDKIFLSQYCIDCDGTISSSASHDNSTGDAGNIVLNTSELITEEGVINSYSVGEGKAGSIQITTDSAFLAGMSDITTEATQGRGGNITFDVRDYLEVSDHSRITAQSYGSSNAGLINITADKLLLTDESRITTHAKNARGGNITVDVRDYLEVSDHSRITAEAEGKNTQDSGGNITISSPAIFTLDNNSRLLANAYAGNGGRIDLNTDQFKVLGNSRIDVSSELGLNGEFLLNSVKLRDEFLALPPQQILSISDLQDRCAGFTRDKAGEFIITIRDVPPQNPWHSKTGTALP
jgi:filamentous hemagglutinin family protein